MDDIIAMASRPQLIVGEYINIGRFEWWKWFIVEPQNRKHLIGKLYWRCK